MDTLPDVNGDAGVVAISVPLALEGLGVTFPVDAVIDNPSLAVLAFVVGPETLAHCHLVRL
jgi:hypothetical protein